MQKKFLATYLFIFVTLLAIMSISRPASDNMRGGTIGLLAPLWGKFLSFKYLILHPTHPSPFTSLSNDEEIQRLQVENQLLTNEIADLQAFIKEQGQLAAQISPTYSTSSKDALLLTDEYTQSIERSIKQLKRRLQAVPARVIFRSFDTWNSCLWINIGESLNQTDKPPAIAKNSPVILGRAIVGLVDYVGTNQSRVKLITDNSLTLSVRAARGGEQEVVMHDYIEGLLDHMDRSKHLLLSPDTQAQLSLLLHELKQTLNPFKKSWYLAKGELLGSTSFTRRSQDPLIKGTGFNYDFPDQEGEGRDLRTGKPIGNSNEQSIPILKTQDILVTTGMDGIFPPRFQVATVTKVGLLKEGDYFYDLEARPIAGLLEELSLVFVLPPLTAADKELTQQ